LQYNRPQNADLVREALTKAGREDLIGYGEECLVRPANAKGQYSAKSSANGAKKTGTQRNATSRGAKPATKGKPTNTLKPANVKNTSAKPAKPTATKSEKPIYKKGWAKPKTKKSGKKK
jgi:hypothetical protein